MISLFKWPRVPSLIFSAFLLASFEARALVWKVRLSPKEGTNSSIQNLRFDPTDLIRDVDAQLKIKGHFFRPGWFLFNESDRMIRTNESGTFFLNLNLAKPENTLKLEALGPNGEYESQEFSLNHELAPGQFLQVRRGSEGEKIEGLHFNSEKYSLSGAVVSPEGYQLNVDGISSVKSLRLISNKGSRPLVSPGKFIIPVVVGQKEITLSAMDESGKTQIETIAFDYQEKKDRRWALFVYSGLVLRDYKQTGLASLSQFEILVVGDFNLVIVPKKWELGLNVQRTVVAFSNEDKLSYTNLSLAIGHYLNFLPPTWTLKVDWGVTWSSILSELPELGFKDLVAPQFYPVLEKDLGNGMLVSGYFKLVPLGVNNVPTLEDRIMSLGMVWQRTLASGKDLRLGFDMSDFKAQLGIYTKVDSTTKQINLGLGF
jgi:hypothetical protein